MLTISRKAGPLRMVISEPVSRLATRSFTVHGRYHIHPYNYCYMCCSTGEGGSYDATEEREKQIIRDRLRANAVCMLCMCACT